MNNACSVKILLFARGKSAACWVALFVCLIAAGKTGGADDIGVLSITPLDELGELDEDLRIMSLPTSRTIGGAPAAPSASGKEGDVLYSYAVSLRTRDDGSHFCGGVLIGKKHVLTAATCVDPNRVGGDSMPDVVTRAMLEMAENDEPEVVCTKQSTVHPKYREQYFPDLAILELCEEIPGSKEIELPPSRESKLGFSEPAILIGWGRISRRSANPAKLQDIRVSFLPLAVCRKMFRQRVRSGQLCFEGGEQGTCAGDAGSPLINQNDGRETLAGIVTSVNPCGDRAKPELHIQVAPYLDWIKDITGG